MSGGIAYVWDTNDELLANCNLDTVELEPVEEEADVAELKELIEKHQNYTGSDVAADILDHWDTSLKQFKKVIPTDYKRALRELAEEKKQLKSEFAEPVASPGSQP